MIFGFALIVVGYSVFYWGLHHFPGVDCPKADGGPSGCRYSLLDVLGVPQSWGIQKGSPLMIIPGNPPGGGSSNSNPSGGGGNTAGGQSPPTPSNQTQPQSPQNATTPSALNPGQSPPQGVPTIPQTQIPGIFGKPPPASAGGVTPAPNPYRRIYCTVCCQSPVRVFGSLFSNNPCPGCGC